MSEQNLTQIQELSLFEISGFTRDMKQHLKLMIEPRKLGIDYTYDTYIYIYMYIQILNIHLHMINIAIMIYNVVPKDLCWFKPK